MLYLALYFSVGLFTALTFAAYWLLYRGTIESPKSAKVMLFSAIEPLILWPHFCWYFLHHNNRQHAITHYEGFRMPEIKGVSPEEEERKWLTVIDDLPQCGMYMMYKGTDIYGEALSARFIFKTAELLPAIFDAMHPKPFVFADGTCAVDLENDDAKGAGGTDNDVEDFFLAKGFSPADEFLPAEGSFLNHAEGSRFNDAEGSRFNGAEGSRFNGAEGSFFNNAEGSNQEDESHHSAPEPFFAQERNMHRWLRAYDPALQLCTGLPEAFDRFEYIASSMIEAGKGQVYCKTCAKLYAAKDVKTEDEGQGGWILGAIRCPREHLLARRKKIHFMRACQD
ncbi:hypothetical protein [Paraglaciecola polaris]|uniref:Uncharacterized protein n=1 Tax=Paraglaciecola polaris LMG 21857 TaxID=1129793 RepID=K7A9J3_9ALTE|nr:hypothetical protein [Paraglaciecola polaris]GAC32080.1 hypothetical protein GPLA_1165 [Paraglaciecola polaris LMG 21857]